MSSLRLIVSKMLSTLSCGGPLRPRDITKILLNRTLVGRYRCKALYHVSALESRTKTTNLTAEISTAPGKIFQVLLILLADFSGSKEFQARLIGYLYIGTYIALTVYRGNIPEKFSGMVLLIILN